MKYKVPFVNPGFQYRKIKREILPVIDRVLSRGDLILREDVEKFEKNLAKICKTKYAVGLNSGTDALFFSLKIAGISKGDEVITVSHTFVATIASIVQCEATPILVDVREDFNMDMDKVEEVITKKTKAIIPVHLNGRMCNMERLMKIARKYNLIVIEDAAQALGAKFKEKMAGSFGLTGCFSFYPFKILGSFGDAGGVITNNKSIAEKILLLRDHGQKTKVKLACYGFNSRLDNLLAAILNAKFKHLSEFVKKRREIAKAYEKNLKDVSEIILPERPNKNKRYFDVFQNYVIRAKKRDELKLYLEKRGIETLIKDPIPVHHQRSLGLFHFCLPSSEKLAREVLSLPMNAELDDSQVRYVIKYVKKFYKEKTKNN